jgi:hypothetical protein
MSWNSGPDTGRACFTGRATQIDTLTAWLNTTADPHLRGVAASPAPEGRPTRRLQGAVRVEGLDRPAVARATFDSHHRRSDQEIVLVVFG